MEDAYERNVEPLVHMAKGCVFAGIVAECGASMTRYSGKWESCVHDTRNNRIEKLPIGVLSFVEEYVTCPECLAELKKRGQEKG